MNQRKLMMLIWRKVLDGKEITIIHESDRAAKETYDTLCECLNEMYKVREQVRKQL